jgi:hypothetical protein
MDSIFKIFQGMSSMQDNYEERKVARINPKENNGVGVSTCFSYDMGYETALLNANTTIPVERYETREEAVIGHEKWVKFAFNENNIKVLKLGYDDLVDDEYIELVRVK